jgi:predicted nucleic acid-binding protein
MTARAFLDTNIVLYTIGQDPHKKAVARQLISGSPMVSAQVINESVNVYLKNAKRSILRICSMGRFLKKA